MSAKYTFLAWDTPIENAPLKLALLQLANNADDDGFSFYSISKMAISCGMSEKTFQRKIADMEKMGILTVERRSNRPSLYTLSGDEMGVSLCRLQNPEATESLRTATESRLVGDRESPVLNNTPNNPPESIIDIDLFTKFWDEYGKKVGKPKAEARFKKLTAEELRLLFIALPYYIKSKPDKQFRKDPERWLMHKCWNDEVITNENRTNQSAGIKESSHERIKRQNIEKYGQPNECGLVVGENERNLGNSVGEGERFESIPRLDNGPFVDY